MRNPKNLEKSWEILRNLEKSWDILSDEKNIKENKSFWCLFTFLSSSNSNFSFFQAFLVLQAFLVFQAFLEKPAKLGHSNASKSKLHHWKVFENFFFIDCTSFPAESSFLPIILHSIFMFLGFFLESNGEKTWFFRKLLQWEKQKKEGFSAISMHISISVWMSQFSQVFR